VCIAELLQNTGSVQAMATTLIENTWEKREEALQDCRQAIIVPVHKRLIEKNLLAEKAEIISRWSEHFREL